VVNYICPNHLEDYIHKIGRTGRAGARGTAITFITPSERHLAYDLIKILDASGQEVPEVLQDLALEFRRLVEAGKAKPHKSRGFGGKGYKFSLSEATKASLRKKEMLDHYIFSDSDTDEEDYDKTAAQKNLKKRPPETIQDFLNIPKFRAASMSAAQTAAKAAILSGK
jgi:ATP-dependent RNA helicase DDX46/PRP5